MMLAEEIWPDPACHAIGKDKLNYVERILFGFSRLMIFYDQPSKNCFRIQNYLFFCCVNSPA
jgi:hypothetical protein